MVAALTPALVSQAADIASQIRDASSDAILEWEFDDGTQLRITPAGIMAVGGGICLIILALILYQLYDTLSIEGKGGVDIPFGVAPFPYNLLI